MRKLVKKTWAVRCFVLVWLAPSFAAHAAGFDCEKITIRVEKLVCADAALSKLDEELNAAYKTASQDEKQAAFIRQTQKQWLKERNRCADVLCVKHAYEARLNRLVNGGMTPHETASTILSAKHYSLYPDTWDWIAPNPERIVAQSFRMLPLDNGDVLILYTEIVPKGKATYGAPVSSQSADSKIGALAAKVTGKSPTQGREVMRQVTLFGGQRVVGAKSNVRILRRQDNELELDDGSKVRVLADKNMGAGELTGGEKIGLPTTYDNWGLNAKQKRACYGGPGRDSLALYVKSTNPPMNSQLVRAVTIFKILDKPWKVHITNECDAERDQTFMTRIHNLPIQQTFPLQDGTFLAQIDTGVLMRFDAKLNTRSPLVNDKYFVLDWDVDFGQSYMHKLTGKEYNFPDWGDYDYQPMVDDLYEHLLTLKKEAGK